MTLVACGGAGSQPPALSLEGYCKADIGPLKLSGGRHIYVCILFDGDRMYEVGRSVFSLACSWDSLKGPHFLSAEGLSGCYITNPAYKLEEVVAKEDIANILRNIEIFRTRAKWTVNVRCDGNQFVITTDHDEIIRWEPGKPGGSFASHKWLLLIPESGKMRAPPIMPEEIGLYGSGDLFKALNETSTLAFSEGAHVTTGVLIKVVDRFFRDFEEQKRILDNKGTSLQREYKSFDPYTNTLGIQKVGDVYNFFVICSRATRKKDPCVGRGADAKVGKAFLVSDTPKTYAAIATNASREAVSLALALHQKYKHAHFAPVIAIFEPYLKRTGLITRFIQELYDGDIQTVQAKLRESEGRIFSLAESLDIIKQVLQSAAALHAGGYAHCDYKCENVLLKKEDGKYKVGVTDLMRACHTKESFHQIGTINYSDPDLADLLLEYSTIDRRTLVPGKDIDKLDVWAIGIILMNLLQDKEPYLNFDVGGIGLVLTSIDIHCSEEGWVRKSLNEVPHSIPEPIILLLEGLLHPVREKRLSAQQALDMIAAFEGGAVVAAAAPAAGGAGDVHRAVVAVDPAAHFLATLTPLLEAIGEVSLLADKSPPAILLPFATLREGERGRAGTDATAELPALLLPHSSLLEGTMSRSASHEMASSSPT